MKKETQSKKPQTAINEDYDVNHPQNLTKPTFNSSSENRRSDRIPGTENLNMEKEENKLTKDSQEAISGDFAPINDDRLHGNIDDQALKNDEKDRDGDDDKLIRK